ncbi:MAG: SHOCT domain-containing protein [Actinomycetota bacterium]|nr:SHOCT domain-containing protein [Actinomycetota bacterium]
MFAYDYPILGAFWTIFMIFIWVAWIMLLFRIFVDLFRSDMGGWGKALWSVFVLLTPFLGVFVYLVVHGRDMTKRDIAAAQQNEAAARAYIRDAAGTSGGGTADELQKLADLHSRGVLNDEEFAQQKAKILAST